MKELEHAKAVADKVGPRQMKEGYDKMRFLDGVEGNEGEKAVLS